MEGEKSLKKNVGSHEVVVVIPGTEEYSSTSKSSEDFVNSKVSESSSQLRGKPANIEVKKQEILASTIEMSTVSSSSPGRFSLSPAQNRPPKPSTTVTSFQRRSLVSTPHANSKSRLIESPYKLVDDTAKIIPASKTSTPKGTGSESKASTPITPKTPLISPGGGGEDDEDDVDDVYITRHLRVEKKKRGKSINAMIVIEWIIMMCLTVVLITNLTVNRFKNAEIWDLRVYKWCVLVLVTCCGRLLTGWFSNLLTFLIERNFLLKNKAFYFLYALRGSVRFFVWIGLILLVWVLLINQKEGRSENAHDVLNKITRGIACTLLGSALWTVKTFLIKLLSSVFQSKTFFQRIQENLYHQYVLQTLSVPQLKDNQKKTGNSRVSGQLNVGNSVQNGKTKVEEAINVDKLKRMDREKVSAWTMSGLIDVISGSYLSISSTLEEVEDNEGEGKKKDIMSEIEAKVEAKRVFKNVDKHHKKYIVKEDLFPFMPNEEVDVVFPMFEGAMETGKVNKSAFTTWVLLVYRERICLSRSLNDTKTAIEELNRITSILLLGIIFILWILLMGITNTEGMLFIGSQILALAFVFGDTFKTVFEGIIFNFIVHPFNVGDRCVIDGIEMVVEEMNLLTTIFLRQDNEKIYYPNSVLAGSPISNFNRNPVMADTVEFSTSVESIAEQETAPKK